MKEKIIRFKTSDGYIIHIRHWKPKKVKTSIICLHGMEDHSGWYTDIAGEICKKGIEAFFIDRRGSGLNKGSRGDVENYERFVQDIYEFMINKELKNVSILGLSLGSLVALSFTIRYPYLINNLILVAPVMKDKLRINLWLEISILFSILFKPQKKFFFPCPSKWISSSKEIIKWIINDRLKQTSFTARFFREIVKMRLFIQTHYNHIKCPQLVILAEDDHIAENQFNLEFFKNNKIIMYRGAKHDIHHNNRLELINDISSWLIR